MNEDRQRLLDIVDYGEQAISIIGDHSFEEAKARLETIYAVRYCLIVIGEASNRLSRDVQDALADVPWREIRATRNRLADAYDLVIDRVIYETVKTHLPLVINRIRRHLSQP